jgi:hypothetical protein
MAATTQATRFTLRLWCRSFKLSLEACADCRFSEGMAKDCGRSLRAATADQLGFGTYSDLSAAFRRRVRCSIVRPVLELWEEPAQIGAPSSSA